METAYEYKFVRLGEYRGSAWFGVSDKTRGAYEDVVRARAGGLAAGADPPARELGCGSPSTGWRRLTQWANAGVFDQLHTSSGRRRVRSDAVHADKAYDSAANRAWLRRRGIRPRIARRGIESSARLGRHRWKVERALSWLSCFRRLQVRWDRDSGAVHRLCARGLRAGLLQPALGGACGVGCGVTGCRLTLDATDGRSHSDTWVACMVWSTTPSSSPVRVSRSICWRSRALNAWIVLAAW
jgi:transposase